MGRPRAFDPNDVVAKAADVFWEHGFQATSIGALEAGTGLDRSSLYHAFGSKQALFDVAAQCYIDGQIGGLLSDLLEPAAGLDAIVRFFRGMAHRLRADPVRSAHGCLIVNAVGELAPSNPGAAAAGATYRDRFKVAFGSALGLAAERGEVSDERLDDRAHILTSMAMGVFLSARIDPADAAMLADGIAEEIGRWRRQSAEGVADRV